MSSYRSLSSGKVITRAKYLKEWDKIILGLEKKYGLVTLAYDPDLKVTHSDYIGQPSLFYNSAFTMPVWFAVKLLSKKGK